MGGRRFLRARKWSVADAYGQFKDTEEWRTANQLEVLYDTIDVDAYEKTRSLVCSALGGRACLLGLALTR